MNMLDSALSLKEIEHALGTAITKRKGRIRTIGDLQLTNEDYKILALRFRGFPKYQNDLKIYEQFSLSLMAYGSYLFQEDAEGKATVEKINKIAKMIPQYMQRKILDELDNTIKEFSLSNPCIHLKNSRQLISLLLFYSYDNDSIYQTYFSELEQYNSENYTQEAFEHAVKKIFVREQFIYDKETRKRAFTMLQKAYIDCSHGCFDEGKMLEKYARLPYLYLSSCCKWFENHESKTNLKIVK